jgi:hypothetical protein
VLYFGLIELLLLDASRELRAARQFRARIVAQTLAENGAEGAAWNLLNTANPPVPFEEEFEEGTMSGRMTRLPDEFTLTGYGESAGLEKTTAKVLLKGYVEDGEIYVDVSVHSQ